MRDVVDEIFAQASTERPELDFQPMALAGRTLRASRLLDQGAKSSLAPFGIETWEYDVLAVLLRTGAPHRLTAGALLRSLVVSFGTLTNRVDRLVAKGLVSRDVDASNRRQVLITLTDEGRRLITAATPAVIADQRKLAAGLSSTECEQLNALLRKLLVSLGDTPEDKGLARRSAAEPAEW